MVHHSLWNFAFAGDFNSLAPTTAAKKRFFDDYSDKTDDKQSKNDS